MPKKLAFFTSSLGRGGTEHTTVALCNHLAESGLTIDLLTLDESGALSEKISQAVSVKRFPKKRVRQIAFSFAEYIRYNNPDGVVVNSWPYTAASRIATIMTRKKTNLLLIEQNDLRLNSQLTARDRKLMRLFGRFIYSPKLKVGAASSGVADSMATCLRISRETVYTLYNPLRELYLRPNTKEEVELMQWWGRGVPLISVGNLKRQKGYPHLLRALSLLNACGDYRLIIVGEGALRVDLERIIAELGLQNRVRLVGHHASPENLIKHARVFVLASEWEGFGLVLVEALALGVPVVSTDCMSGPSEILQGGRYGILVPPASAEALKEGVERCIASDFGTNVLRERAESFRVAHVAENYINVLLGN
jgi:glycosyltransferase involved in cell wall biosynthesis